MFIFFDVFDGTIGRGVIRRVIRACVTYQVNFVRTGNPVDCRQMGLKDIESFTGIDASVVSRATRNVRIISPAGEFTLNSSDPSLDVPSLFDDGGTRTDGSKCSRKEVFVALRQLIAEEDPANALADEDFSDELERRGYLVARRTVSKYRSMLGIPKRADRRIKKKRIKFYER